MDILSIINLNYNVSYSNVESIDQSDIYLLAEKHTLTECKEVNGRLISSLARNHIVSIFVEGISSMKELKTNKSRLKDLTFIDGFVQEDHLHFYGWDMDDDELFEKKMAIAPLMQRLESTMKESEQLKTLIIQLENKILQIFPDYPNDIPFEIFLSLSEDVMQDFMKNIQHIEKSKDRSIILEEEIAEIEEQIKGSSIKLVEETFPRRVDAMVTTLQKIRKMRDEGRITGKALFVAGMAHLLTLEKDRGNVAFDLTPLYDELSHHHASILIPRMIQES